MPLQRLTAYFCYIRTSNENKQLYTYQYVIIFVNRGKSYLDSLIRTDFTGIIQLKVADVL